MAAQGEQPRKPVGDLTRLEAHYEFGENWASFEGTIDETSVRHAEEGVLKLISREELSGRSFLDIGCGSGIHSLAAARLGAGNMLSTDIDPKCIETTRKLLDRFGVGGRLDTLVVSAFDLDPAVHGQFDIVYSWGVLHHTGDLDRAMRKAAAMVAPGGLFVFALYRRTSGLMDRFWTWEKRWYTAASPKGRERAEKIYTAAYRAAMRLKGQNPDSVAAGYKQTRGADFAHDVSDWLGGYPYEVISPLEVEALMRDLGFSHVRSYTLHSRFGVFGSGCDEYIYRARAG